MKRIDLGVGHRQRHFEFFCGMEVPYFSVTAPLDVTAFVRHVRAAGLRLYVATVYLVSDAANRVPELRRRIRGAEGGDAAAREVVEHEVVEHEVVHPSFSVPTDEADVFSFCEVRFRRPHAAFAAAAEARMARMRTAPVFADDPARDDYLFLSAFPWAAFSAVTQPMRLSPPDSVPRIVWGRVAPPPGARVDAATPTLHMPVSIQAHHAVVDGRHVGRFFEALQASFADPATHLARDHATP